MTATNLQLAMRQLRQQYNNINLPSDVYGVHRAGERVGCIGHVRLGQSRILAHRLP